jgi:hypothetical protein
VVSTTQRAPAVTLRRGEQGSGLVGGQRPHLATLRPRHIDGLSDVAPDVPPLDRLPHRVVQRGMDLAHRPLGEAAGQQVRVAPLYVGRGERREPHPSDVRRDAPDVQPIRLVGSRADARPHRGEPLRQVALNR